MYEPPAKNADHILRNARGHSATFHELLEAPQSVRFPLVDFFANAVFLNWGRVNAGQWVRFDVTSRLVGAHRSTTRTQSQNGSRSATQR